MYKNQYKPFKTERDAEIYLDNYIDLKNYVVISKQDLSGLKSKFEDLKIIDGSVDHPDRDIDQLDFDEGSKKSC